MPDLAPDISFLKDIDPSGRLTDLVKQLIDAHNNIGRQTNASPVGSTAAPPKISALNVVGGGSFHRISIEDNNPVPRGIQYHVEWDTSPQFTSPKQITLGPDKNLDTQLGVNGLIYWRGYSSLGAQSPPSEPVYFGGANNPTGVDAGTVTLAVTATVSGSNATGTATGHLVGPAPLPNAGSGTEPSQFPQSGAGFGFSGDRGNSPRLPL